MHYGWYLGVSAKMFTIEHPSPPLPIFVNGTTIHQIAQSENLGLIQYIPHILNITNSHSSEIYPEI